MNRALVSLSVLVSISVFSSLGIAAIRYVDGSVSQSGDGQSWETAFTTIQEGIDAASNGDTVMVAPGIYIENIHFAGKNITLTSTDPLDADIVAGTIIDGNQSGPAVAFAGTETETCILSGFTIRNGRSDCGGGGIFGAAPLSTSHCSIQNNIVTGNSGTIGGGLAYLDGAICDNIITENSADTHGGGLAYCGGQVERNEICDNSAGFDGGGLYGCLGTVMENLIKGNRARSGGGLALCQGTIERNTIPDNSASQEGGGLYRCDRTVRNNTISGNSAKLAGAGLADCDGRIQGNLISLNSAIYGFGAGLYDCDGPILNNAIGANWSYAGAGLFECDDIVQNNVIYGNLSDRYGGGLAYCDGIIGNNTVCYNTAGRGGGLYECAGEIRNCIIWGNKGYGGQPWNSSIPVYSSIEGWTGGGLGNIAADPRFVDADGPDNELDTYDDNNYRLLADSPCIDAGKNENWMWTALDLDGKSRILYGGHSVAVDMGAYEYYINQLKPGPQADETTFTWSSLADKTYSIFHTQDLLTWHLVAESFPSAGNQTTSWIDDGTLTGVPPSLAPRRFYRVLENR